MGASFSDRMPLFSRTVEPDAPFKKNELVKATMDFPGVPSGTEGKIKVVNGFSWSRYWVFFENGIDLGQLDRNDLVRPQHWDHFFEQKAIAEEKAAKAAAAALSGATEAAADTGAVAAGDSDDPMAALRAMVPAHLLERSEAARIRLLGS